MDQHTIDHTKQQLAMRATSDTVSFNALAIIEAYERGEEPLGAAPKLDAQGEMAARKHAPAEASEAPAEAPKRRSKK